MTNRVFRDDFEISGFTRWSATLISAGCSLVVQKVLVHHGGYAAEAITDGSAAAQAARVEHTLVATKAELYARLYARVKSHDLAVNTDKFFMIRFRAVTGAQPVAYAGWAYTTSLKWVLAAYNAAIYTPIYGVTPETNRWYCIELYWKLDAAAGIARLWVDGINILSLTGLDSNNYGNIATVNMGLAETANTVTADVVFDCCSIDTNYIGTEVALRNLNPYGLERVRNRCRLISNCRRKAGIMGLK